MEEKKGEVPPVEKKGKGRMVGILVALVLVLSAGAAGAVFAPRLLAKAPAAAKPSEDTEADSEHAEEGSEGEHGEAESEEEAEKPAEKAEEKATEPASGFRQRAGIVGEIAELSPIVVDSRAQDGSIRHVKVVLSIEHPKELTAEEFKHYVPFAREAAIAYLRTRDFEQLSDPKNFDSLRKELSGEIIDAVGKKHARRVLFTDYVVQ